MIEDMVIVDAVVHPYNLAPENQDPTAKAQLETVYAAHKLSFDPRNEQFMLTHDEFFSDLTYETLAVAEFVESPVDLAVIHALPTLGMVKSYMNDPYRAALFRDRYPHRFKVYATVDTPLVKAAIGQLEGQLERHRFDGLKLYPAFFYDGKGTGWRLDGEDFATPLLEAARRSGIRHIAVHKTLWLPPAPRDAFNIDDVDSPLDRFPEMTFEIVHAGVAFLDQTCELMSRHANLYLNLETMFAYILTRPRVFAKILGTLISRCGSERLLFATGNNLAHPRPILEAFANYQLPHDVIEEYGFKAITSAERRNILGLNALRMHGLESASVIADVRKDEFSQARARRIPGPWSVLRERRAWAVP
jgi:predicted TIM-barrel fold metal-dependent hydrolase